MSMMGCRYFEEAPDDFMGAERNGPHTAESNNSRIRAFNTRNYREMTGRLMIARYRRHDTPLTFC